jgi:hypothetical protein
LRLPYPFLLRLKEENEEASIERALWLAWKLKDLSGQCLGLERAIGAFLMFAVDLSVREHRRRRFLTKMVG